jgi:Reverse transcriptase (RNA-dependent DNA polymerase)
MVESEVVMPRMGAKGEAESVTSRTRVRQGCPISPLLFIIVFDLLLESLKASGEVSRVSEYIDDLAVTVKDLQAVNRLIPVLEEYCEVTGVVLNY